MCVREKCVDVCVCVCVCVCLVQNCVQSCVCRNVSVCVCARAHVCTRLHMHRMHACFNGYVPRGDEGVHNVTAWFAAKEGRWEVALLSVSPWGGGRGGCLVLAVTGRLCSQAEGTDLLALMFGRHGKEGQGGCGCGTSRVPQPPPPLFCRDRPSQLPPLPGHMSSPVWPLGGQSSTTHLPPRALDSAPGLGNPAGRPLELIRHAPHNTPVSRHPPLPQ
jgi:hypothetical protein